MRWRTSPFQAASYRLEPSGGFFRQKDYEVWVTKSASHPKGRLYRKFMGILNSRNVPLCISAYFSNALRLVFFHAQKDGMYGCTAPKVENWNWKTSTRKRAKQFIGCVAYGWDREVLKQKLFVFCEQKHDQKLIKWFICFWKFHSALAKQAVAVSTFSPAGRSVRRSHQLWRWQKSQVLSLQTDTWLDRYLG